jgi:hypothetical protein
VGKAQARPPIAITAPPVGTALRAFAHPAAFRDYRLFPITVTGNFRISEIVVDAAPKSLP